VLPYHRFVGAFNYGGVGDACPRPGIEAERPSLFLNFLCVSNKIFLAKLELHNEKDYIKEHPKGEKQQAFCTDPEIY
jgi:hypothetical protein